MWKYTFELFPEAVELGKQVSKTKRGRFQVYEKKAPWRTLRNSLSYNQTHSRSPFQTAGVVKWSRPSGRALGENPRMLPAEPRH